MNRTFGILPIRYLWMALFVTTGCGSTAGPDTNGSAVALIVVSPSDEPLVSVGQDLQLGAVVTTVAGNTVVNPPVVWSTSDAGVLTVTNSGLMTGQGDGTATVTAALEGKTGTVDFRIVDLSGTWTGSETTDTVSYILMQTGTSVDGTFQSLLGFPPITSVDTGALTGSLDFERYTHALTLTTEMGCELLITGTHSVTVESTGDLVLEPGPPGALSSSNCTIAGTINFVTLRRP